MKEKKAVIDEQEPIKAEIVSEVLPEAPPKANLPAILQPKVLAAKSISEVILFTPEMIQQAQEISAGINFQDTNAIILFGMNIQESYLESIKDILEDSRLKEAGFAGDIAASIIKEIKSLGLEDMKKELTNKSFNDWASGIPLIGKYFSAIKRFMARQQQFVDFIEDIQKGIKKNMAVIAEGNERLDKMLQQVEKNFYQLAVRVKTIEIAVSRGKIEYEQLQQRVNDPIAANKAKFYYEQIMLLDQRGYTMLSKVAKAPKTGLKVLTIQQSGRIELGNLVNALVDTLPALAETAVELVALFKLRKAQSDGEKLEQAQEQLDAISDELTGTTAMASREAQKRMIARYTDLENSTRKILETIKQIEAKDKEIAEQREVGKKALNNIITEFGNTLKEMSVRS